MLVWTTIWGKTALIASGDPLGPSKTAIRMSPRQHVFSWFITRSQNFTPSACSIQMPRISFAPSGRIMRMLA